MLLGHILATVLLAAGTLQTATTAIAPNTASFNANGVRLQYIVAGQGSPVILIHGLHSNATINWQRSGIVADLARTHRVIALDLPGHGGSEKVTGDAAYGLQLVEDVILLMDHLQIDRAQVVGYSLGGMIAVKLMARHPERVTSGIIGGMGWLREGSASQRFWARQPSSTRNRTPGACIRNIGKMAVDANELRSIRVPVELIVGDRDPVKRPFVTPLQNVRRDWPLVEIKGAGHSDTIMKPQFRAEITRWINSH